MIVGGPGSGKSTLARWIGARSGLPVVHMDHIHWHENWVPRARFEKQAMAIEVAQGDAWVFEGGMSSTYDARVARADLLIWLDLPVALRLWRVTKRLFRYLGQNRPDLPRGCKERLHSETWAFYRFIWSTRHTSRVKILPLVDAPREGQEVSHLRSPSEVAAFQERFAHRLRAGGR